MNEAIQLNLNELIFDWVRMKSKSIMNSIGIAEWGAKELTLRGKWEKKIQANPQSAKRGMSWIWWTVGLAEAARPP